MSRGGAENAEDRERSWREGGLDADLKVLLLEVVDGRAKCRSLDCARDDYNRGVIPSEHSESRDLHSRPR
jgi:hypothetical protein